MKLIVALAVLVAMLAIPSAFARDGYDGPGVPNVNAIFNPHTGEIQSGPAFFTLMSEGFPGMAVNDLIVNWGAPAPIIGFFASHNEHIPMPPMPPV
jgi:hypothetical protein